MAEEDIRRGWLAAARSWASSAVSRVMAPWRQAEATPDASAVLSLGDEWTRLVAENVGPPIVETLASAYETITGRPRPIGFDRQAYVQQYLRESVNRMSNTPDQVYRFIADQLGKGVAEGDSPRRLALRVQAVFVVTDNPWWENRAATVAATEVGGAENAGRLAGAAYLQDTTGKTILKVWRAHDDERTRVAHHDADGQEHPLTQPFTVGGEQLMHPGDPKGSAGNVIRCRCSLMFRAP